MWREPSEHGSIKHRRDSHHYGKRSTKEKVLKPLWKEIKNKNAEGLDKTLQQDGIDLPEQDPDGILLMFSVKSNYLNITNVLLNHKSPVCCDKDEEGSSPLHHAAKYGNTNLIAMFIQHNVPINEVTMYDKRTALHIAVKHKKIDAIYLLLSNKADSNAQDIYGYSALHVASYLGYEDVARMLLQHDADVNLCDNAGWRPLHHSAAGDQAHITKLLLRNKANISAQSNYGKTALHIACDKDKFNAVQVLLDEDALTDIKDVHGKMPHEYAKNREIAAMMKLALKPMEEESQKKHIEMKIKSKSLIDLLDPEYLQEDYYDRHTLSEGDLFRSNETRKSWKNFSLGGIANAFLNNIQRKRRKLSSSSDQGRNSLAICNSVAEFRDRRSLDLTAGNVMFNAIDEVAEPAPSFEIDSDTVKEADTISNEPSSIQLMETEAENRFYFTRKIKRGSSTSSTSQESIDNSCEIEIHNTNQDTSLPNEVSENELSDKIKAAGQFETAEMHIANKNSSSSDHVNKPFETIKINKTIADGNYKKFTCDHVDSCLDSIGHVYKAINDIIDSGETPQQSNKLQELKEFMHNWYENTEEIKTKLANS